MIVCVKRIYYLALILAWGAGVLGAPVSPPIDPVDEVVREEPACTCYSLSPLRTHHRAFVLHTRSPGGMAATFGCSCAEQKPRRSRYVVAAFRQVQIGQERDFRGCVNETTISDLCESLEGDFLLSCSLKWNSGAAGYADSRVADIGILAEVSRSRLQASAGACFDTSWRVDALPDDILLE